MKHVPQCAARREEIYRMNTLTFLEGALRDVRHAVRMIGTQRGFSAAVLLSLALGTGANVAIFTVVTEPESPTPSSAARTMCCKSSMAQDKRPEDDHVQGSRDHLGLERRFLSRHAARSTID